MDHEGGERSRGISREGWQPRQEEAESEEDKNGQGRDQGSPREDERLESQRKGTMPAPVRAVKPGACWYSVAIGCMLPSRDVVNSFTGKRFYEDSAHARTSSLGSPRLGMWRRRQAGCACRPIHGPG